MQDFMSSTAMVPLWSAAAPAVTFRDFSRDSTAYFYFYSGASTLNVRLSPPLILSAGGWYLPGSVSGRGWPWDVWILGLNEQ